MESRFELVFVRYALSLPPGRKILPVDVGPALEKAFKAPKGYASKLWNKAVEQLTAGHTLFLYTKKVSDWCCSHSLHADHTAEDHR